ncbi:serine kinase [Sedimentibacter sp. zth1]|uniref:DRTGG domain-containing protein n=1 Tax=Sedimentibacter sp. zth1 TaxID=2816908 RepID=UPI001A932452|nr:DRTGG domain-containing protein [Sedimentibacter sp. zth1]QSX06200.1 serine kinase [Sedimentibacter sp. zth1]
MKILELSKILNCEIIVGTSETKDIDIKNVYIGDLLSIVMSKAQAGCVWITIQTHLNIVAVAELIEMSCIIVAENMEIEGSTILKAEKLNIPILKSKQTSFELACLINNIK